MLVGNILFHLIDVAWILEVVTDHFKVLSTESKVRVPEDKVAFEDKFGCMD